MRGPVVTQGGSLSCHTGLPRFGNYNTEGVRLLLSPGICPCDRDQNQDHHKDIDTIFKRYLLPLALLGGVAIAADESLDEPLMFIKGDITRAQFMERAEQRFARQDSNGDGTLSVAEREAAMAKMHEAMKQSGKAMPGKMGNMRPMQDTTKAQFMERHEAVFTKMDKNGDGVIDEAERASIKARLGQGTMSPAQ